MKVSLLISTYNWPQALELVLKSALVQSHLPNTILIADDGSTNETKKLIDFFKAESKTPIKHVWHKDNGFRKSMILNKAIAKSNDDYIIQVDGDCILHKHFIKDHIDFAKKNQFLFGSRVNIQKKILEKLFSTKKIKFHFFSTGIKKRTRTLHIPILANFFKESSKLSSKLRGCNISYFKSDFLNINGYNEDFEGWGKEDSELAIRLLNNNVKGRRLRYKGIVYHLWHQIKSKNNLEKNKAISNKIEVNGVTFCKNGVDKYLR